MGCPGHDESISVVGTGNGVVSLDAVDVGNRVGTILSQVSGFPGTHVLNKRSNILPSGHVLSVATIKAQTKYLSHLSG